MNKVFNPFGHTFKPFGGGGMAPLYPGVIVYDQFTGTNGDLLAAHAPLVCPNGAAWEFTNQQIDIQNNRAHYAAGSTGSARARINTGLADCTLSCLLYPTATGADGGICIRDNGGLNFLYVLYTQSGGVTGTLQIVQRNPLLVLGTSGAISLITNATYILEVILAGSSITAKIRGYYNELTTVTGTSAVNQAVTTHGLLLSNANITIDEFQVLP